MRIMFWRILVLFALLIAAVPAWAQGDPEETFTWEEYDLTLIHPAELTAQKMLDWIYAFSTGPVNLASSTVENPMIMVAFDDPAGSLFGPGIVTESLEDTAQNWADLVLRELDSIEATTLAGQEAVRITGIENLTGASISAVITFDPEGRLLFIAAISPEDEWENFMPVFEAVLESVAFGSAGETAAGLLGALTGNAGSAVQTGPWQVASATPIVLPEDASLIYHIIPAPDGRHVAYYRPDEEDNELLCSMDVTNGEESCVTLPADFGPLQPTTSGFWSMRWSADSTRLAVTGVPFIRFRDTDLTTVDFETGTATVLIEDAYEGGLLSSDMTPEASIEMQPVWSPDGSRIAIERTMLGESGRYGHSTLSLVDAATGKLTDLSLLPGSDAVDIDAGSIIGIDWSPDGSTLAVSIAHQQRDPNYDGLWLVDVDSGQFEQLVTLDDAWSAYTEIYPEVEGEFHYFAPVSWSPDGSRLLFWAENRESRTGRWPLWVDVSGGEITPVTLPDFPDPRMVVPTQALWSPDGMIMLLNRALVDTEEEVTLLDPAAEENGDLVSLRLIDPATGEITLLGQLPLIPTLYGDAAWGPGGNVIVNGYYLEMRGE